VPDRAFRVLRQPFLIPFWSVPVMDRVRHVLCHDGALWLHAPVRPLAGVERWVPRFLDGGAVPSGDAAGIRVTVDAGAGRLERPRPRPTFGLDTVDAWVDDAAREVRLRCEGAGAGRVGLQERRAALRTPAAQTALSAAELFTMLTVSSALLLGRLGRTLVHAAAVVDPAGRAWLLVGDTHAGKTTTTVNLLRAGWGFLSDDHVVAFAGGDGGVWIEGWPRPFHVDEGWARGEVTGRRAAVEPASFGAERWRRTAPLGGLLFPRVDPPEPTRLARLSGAAALSALLRQTPWLMTDREAAPRLLSLLRAMSERPSYALSAGLDTYADPLRLAAVCETVLG
jgi:hypothetical protein